MDSIVIKGLSKAYKGFALRDISLTLPGGCIMGLIGENGAGKSTLIKAILDIVRRDSGEVTILGHDCSDEGELILAKEDIGVVLDEVGIPESFRAKQINAVMKELYKKWDENKFFALLKKLRVPEGKRFKDLSRGNKMKMGIAIALSHDAKLLILDEATNGLDPVVRDEVTDIFYDFTRDEDHSILVSSHIVSDLEKLCDYITFIHQGRVMLSEEKDVLLEQYAIAHCDPEDLESIDPSAIAGRKVTGVGCQLLVRRDAVPETMALTPVTVEELFVFMIKEAEQ